MFSFIKKYGIAFIIMISYKKYRESNNFGSNKNMNKYVPLPKPIFLEDSSKSIFIKNLSTNRNNFYSNVPIEKKISQSINYPRKQNIIYENKMNRLD